MYADDTVVYTSGNNVTDIAYDSQSIFNNIISWCDNNRLTINEKKTKSTVFNNNGNEGITSICYKQQPLEYVKSYKYLCVNICDDLTMDTYVKNVYKNANYKVYVLQNREIYNRTCSGYDIKAN